MVNIKKKITKKMWLKLTLFVAVIGTAALFDYFFDDDIVALDEIEAEAEANQNAGEQNTVYLISQTTTVAVKSSIQITYARKFQAKSHDKLIQKYYQIRNYQVLKAEVQTQTTPLINTYRYLAFKNYYFSNPDDDPSKA
jgi:hypothetical protein